MAVGTNLSVRCSWRNIMRGSKGHKTSYSLTSALSSSSSKSLSCWGIGRRPGSRWPEGRWQGQGPTS